MDQDEKEPETLHERQIRIRDELLKDALDMFHGEHELCDEVNSDEWIWRYQVLYLLEGE